MIYWNNDFFPSVIGKQILEHAGYTDDVILFVEPLQLKNIPNKDALCLVKGPNDVHVAEYLCFTNAKYVTEKSFISKIYELAGTGDILGCFEGNTTYDILGRALLRAQFGACRKNGHNYIDFLSADAEWRKAKRAFELTYNQREVRVGQFRFSRDPIFCVLERH